MARPFASWENALEKFAKDLADTTLAPRTVTFYRETVHAVLLFLQKHSLPTLPNQICTQDLKKFLDCMAVEHLAIATRKGYLSGLKKYLEHFGNHSFNALQYKLPNDTRPKVDWLTQAEAVALLKADKSPIQAIVIHLELCLGMRRVEVVRLRAADVHSDEGYLIVNGKGPQGGKPRTIPYASGTLSVMNLAMRRRNEQIREALARNPIQTVPDNLIIWSKGGKLHAYSEEGYGIDKVVCEPLSEKMGFSFSNHTLRRTFGRMMYRAGVEPATIAKILGHESTEVTLRYIGVDLDDMKNAMQKDIFGEC